ncbi:MAG: hypothetical protein H6Q75_1325 [Firmicutes bacterium]|nr:hypothetical protein [Bacillota bacterium]
MNNVKAMEAMRQALTKMVMTQGVANEKVIQMSQLLDLKIVRLMKASSCQGCKKEQVLYKRM